MVAPGEGGGKWVGVGACAYKEAMDVGEEDGQLAARPQQLSILYGGHEVAAVWTASCGAGGWINSQRLGREVAGWSAEKWVTAVALVSRHVVLPAINVRIEANHGGASRLTFPSRSWGPSPR